MKKKRKVPKLLPFDIIIIIIIAGCGVFLTVRGLGQKGSRVLVNAAGVKYEYSVSQNGTYTVAGELGPTTFEIKDGRVRITDSPCPNKTCISQGWHNPLICLPNKVMITVEEENSVKTGQGRGPSNEEVQLDAVSE